MPKPRKSLKPGTFEYYKKEANRRLAKAKPGAMLLLGGHRFVRLERPTGKDKSLVWVSGTSLS